MELIKNLTTEQLIETFIQTGKDESGDPNIYTVRGWLMDELEARNPEAFDAWLESETPEDEDLPKYFN